MVPYLPFVINCLYCIRYSLFSSFISSNGETTFDEKDYTKLLMNPPSPSLVLQIITGLNNGKISRELLLKLSIHVANTRNHLIFPALALRNGADPNIYYETTEQKIHILGYIHIVMTNVNADVVNDMVILLKSAGSDDGKSLFDPKSDDTNKISVNEWLKHKYPNSAVFSDISSKDMARMLLLLDRCHSNIDNIADEKYAIDAIEKQAQNILNRYFDKIKGLDIAADFAVKYLNMPAYEKCLDQEYMPIYPIINNILVY